MKPKLAISSSGGRTSEYMTKICLEMYGDTHDICVVFANTGAEHENTLDFIRKCDEHFGFGTVWLEAVVGKAGVGIRHKIVDFKSASRKGEPFERVIEKHGIPNAGVNHCTRRLKIEVIQSYLASVGFVRGKGLNYSTAIGIRADEMDRMSKCAKAERFVYPLVGMGTTKADVLKFWRSMPFDLDLPGEHYGNCVTCWKKSNRKLMTIAVEEPSRFDFFRRMEKEHAKTQCDTGSGRVFFRREMSVEDIFEMARFPFHKYTDAEPPDMEQGTFSELLDVGSSCGESCEIGAD